jgi:hypothetical protein
MKKNPPQSRKSQRRRSKSFEVKTFSTFSHLIDRAGGLLCGKNSGFSPGR